MEEVVDVVAIIVVKEGIVHVITVAKEEEVVIVMVLQRRGGGGGCCCDNCGKGSGSCCCDNCGNCCSHSGSGGSCCDGSSSGGTQYQPSKDELELLDSINNTINNLPIEDQVIDKLERLKILDQNQLTEITHLVDSVAEVDQEKLERTKEVIDLVEAYRIQREY